MRAALVVLEITRDVEANLQAVVRSVRDAAASGADLVLFPEAALTGLVNVDEPTRDLPLGRPVPGPEIDTVAAAAREAGVHVALGLLERTGDVLYDAAVLLGPDGRIALHHRRIHPGWHGRAADPAVYGRGRELAAAELPFGRAAFLICGELFDEALVERARALDADWLLFPFWRCFDDGAIDARRWSVEEHATYAERFTRIGATALMVNALASQDMEGGAFGGAWALAADGRVLGSLPLGEAGTLCVDLPWTGSR